MPANSILAEPVYENVGANREAALLTAVPEEEEDIYNNNHDELFDVDFRSLDDNNTGDDETFHDFEQPTEQTPPTSPLPLMDEKGIPLPSGGSLRYYATPAARGINPFVSILSNASSALRLSYVRPAPTPPPSPPAVEPESGDEAEDLPEGADNTSSIDRRKRNRRERKAREAEKAKAAQEAAAAARVASPVAFAVGQALGAVTRSLRDRSKLKKPARFQSG